MASVNSRDEDLAAAGAERAVARNEAATRALAASTGDAGQAEGDQAKAAVENDPKGIDFA